MLHTKLDATTYCKSYAGHLFEPKNQAHFDSVIEFAYQPYYAKNKMVDSQVVWLGINLQGNNWKYESDNLPIIWNNWKAGNPGIEDCATFDLSDRKWMDYGCANLVVGQVICESNLQ